MDLYGSGYLRDKLIAEADRLQMNIHVNEPTIDIFEKYLNSSILVLTSLFEPFGLVMPEAMSCGVPVIVYDSTACPELVQEGCGFVLPSGDIDGIVSSLDKIKMLSKQSFSNNCISFVKNTFEKEKLIKQTIGIYENLIKMR